MVKRFEGRSWPVVLTLERIPAAEGRDVEIPILTKRLISLNEIEGTK